MDSGALVDFLGAEFTLCVQMIPLTLCFVGCFIMPDSNGLH